MVNKIKKIQTIIFDGRIFNKRAVRDWINRKGFKFMKNKKDPIDTEIRISSQGKYKEYRVRQYMPSKFKSRSFMTTVYIKCPNEKKVKKFKGVKVVKGIVK